MWRDRTLNLPLAFDGLRKGKPSNERNEFRSLWHLITNLINLLVTKLKQFINEWKPLASKYSSPKAIIFCRMLDLKKKEN